MAYIFEQLTPQLTLIRWHKMANHESARLWLADIANSLDDADEPQYYISDLRDGYVKDVRILRKHGDLTRHPNYGGGVTLGPDFRAEFYVNTADNLGQSGQITHTHTYKGVRSALEEMQPGVTADLDLQSILSR